MNFSFFQTFKRSCFTCARWLTRPLGIVFCVGTFLLLAYGGYVFFQYRSYRAVFLTNGQVYFGKYLPSIFSDVDTLTDIFYPQQPSLPQTSSSPSASSPFVTLIKLGKEMHGPQDTMYLPVTSVLFWEDLRDDSEVVVAINRQHNATKK